MVIDESGKMGGKKILLLPGTACNVKINFGEALQLLEKEYHVIAVNYDGFDNTGSEFTTMNEQAKKIEDYVLEKHDGKVDIAYGSSLGGSFVGILAQRKRIHMDHAILGSSDMDQNGPVSAWLISKIVSNSLGKVMKTGNLPESMWLRIEHKMGKDACEKFKAMFHDLGSVDYSFTRKSLFNEYYSDLVTPIEDRLEIPGTTFHVFYALHMGEKYRTRYLKHFAHPDIIEQDFGHEMLLICHPQEWVEAVRKCTEE